MLQIATFVLFALPTLDNCEFECNVRGTVSWGHSLCIRTAHVVGVASSNTIPTRLGDGSGSAKV